MMMLHLTFALELMALTMGTGLLVWSIKNPGKGSWLGKLFGFVVMVFSIIAIVCILSCAIYGDRCYKPMNEMGMMTPSGMMPHDHGGMAEKTTEHKK